jgi:hypothetical protein
VIDDPVMVAELMEKLQAHLPILANPTPELVRALRKQGVKIKPDRALSITRVFYLGDEGGISCDVTPPQEPRAAVVVSLTHLRIAPGRPLYHDIRDYQRRRVRGIAASGG